MHRASPSAGRFDPRSGQRGSVEVPIGDDDACALAGEPARDTLADPLGSAGDDCNAVETGYHGVASPFVDRSMPCRTPICWKRRKIRST